MRIVIYLLVFPWLNSCTRGPTTEEIITSNPSLVGTWSGSGRFLDVDVDERLGEVPVELVIGENKEVKARIGRASILEARMEEADYGYAVIGKLDSEVSRDIALGKQYLILLLVLPEEDRDGAISSDANFHLKSNLFFDFGMRVGGVTLYKNSL